MKFWTAFITMFIMTGILRAQVPYNMNNLQPYYPGATAPPYFPQAYYLQPYAVQPPYPETQVTIGDNNAEIDVLTRQVQQLTEEIMRLQAQLALVQQQPAAPPVEAAAAQPQATATPVLVFKDGTRIDAQGYAIAGQTLWILSPSGTERVALSQLNVAATQRENNKRGIQFPDVGP
jgi:hypothetical protein